MSRLLITGSRNHQWTSYDSHALLIAVREILEKTRGSTHEATKRPMILAIH